MTAHTCVTFFAPFIQKLKATTPFLVFLTTPSGESLAYENLVDPESSNEFWWLRFNQDLSLFTPSLQFNTTPYLLSLLLLFILVVLHNTRSSILLFITFFRLDSQPHCIGPKKWMIAPLTPTAKFVKLIYFLSHFPPPPENN